MEVDPYRKPHGTTSCAVVNAIPPYCDFMHGVRCLATLQHAQRRMHGPQITMSCMHCKVRYGTTQMCARLAASAPRFRAQTKPFRAETKPSPPSGKPSTSGSLHALAAYPRGGALGYCRPAWTHLNTTTLAQC
jgi:hypothetical protein